MLHSEELAFHQLSLIKLSLEPSKTDKLEEAYHLLRLYQLTGDQRFRPIDFKLTPQLGSSVRLSPKVPHVEDVVSVSQKSILGLGEFCQIEKPNVRFNDIAGLLDVKDAVKLEVVYPRLRPDLYSLYKKTPGSSILIWGPPGCGKTLLAKAIATEIDANFISPKISDLLSRFVGDSEKKISNLFKAIRSYTSQCGNDAVLFLDEFDSLVPRGGPSYVRRIKDQFLTELDGLGSKKNNLLVMAATGKPYYIDSAARRSGRFEKTFFIPPPDLVSRKQIFELRLSPLIKNDVVSDDVVISDLAETTEGYSGADIAAICDNTRDRVLSDAIRNDANRKMTREDFDFIISRTRRSIIPWINEALRATKLLGEEEYYPEIQGLAQLINEVKQLELQSRSPRML